MSNRLASESSLYLRQHGENPVDWYPWDEEALGAAAERDVPILLSIGYSSCHWCHVMAHESFEDAATAEYMNEHFVCIKVDREERPDIDAIYMEAAQAMSGHGGWPLTAFLTPEQVPFFAGTYFPPDPRPNMPSFMQLMASITDVWRNSRASIEERSKLLVDQLSMTARLTTPDDPIKEAVLEHASVALRTVYDARLGGFGGAPKFPPHSTLEFLLGSTASDDREMALHTLRRIAAGGIHDQLAGGFSRYSVDDRWHVPHFEKMLYDNALLARAYLHGFLVTGEADFARVTRSTLDWMLSDLYAPGHGFASALDADSLDADGHLEEGAFYAWSIDELREVLGEAVPTHLEQLIRYWGAIDHGEFDGNNVLFENLPDERPDEQILARAAEALLARRNTRAHPARDDKRIASWNALALAALADASAVLNEPDYLTKAVETAEFIQSELTSPDGRILRSWTDGRPGGPGYLEDHAYMAAAFLTLFEVSGDERWFVRSEELCQRVLDRFEDQELGGFFSTADDQERLIVRRKDIEDNPIPSGNSAAASVLLRMAALTGDQAYRSSATRALMAVQRMAARVPLGFGHALQAIDFHVGPVKEVALVGPSGAERDALLHVLRGAHRPRVVAAISSDAAQTRVPLLRDRSTADGRPAAYVCQNFACQLPVTQPRQFAELLED